MKYRHTQQDNRARHVMLGAIVELSALESPLHRDAATTSLRILRNEVKGRLGDYELLHRIGSGGMAEVFLACDATLGSARTPVALKRILPGLAHRDEIRQLFVDEARLTTRMTHRHLAPAMDIRFARSHGFFTMPFSDGIPLTTLLRTAARAGEPPPEGAVLGIIGALAIALHYGHELAGADGRPLSVAHCDVSPTNVLVSRDGEVKLVDWGIARGHHVTQGVPALGRGTLGYASPEQTSGRGVDRRGDVFSLGVVLWEMSTMRRLFRGVNRADTAMRVANADPPRPSTVRPRYNPDLEDIVMHALRRDPDARTPSALRLDIALERYARRHDIVADKRAIATWVRRVLVPRPAAVGTA